MTDQAGKLVCHWLDKAFALVLFLSSLGFFFLLFFPESLIFSNWYNISLIIICESLSFELYWYIIKGVVKADKTFGFNPAWHQSPADTSKLWHFCRQEQITGKQTMNNLLDKRFLQLKFQRLLEEMQRMPWGSILAIFMKSNIQQNIWRNRFFFTFVLKNCNTCIFKLFCCNFFWLISVHILCIVTNKCKCSETNDIEIKLKLFVKVI